MTPPQYTTLVGSLLTQLDMWLNHYVFQAYTALADYLKVPLSLAMVLYIVIMGWGITQGWITLSLRHLLKAAMKLALINTAAMHWDWFSHYGVELISTGAGQIGQVLIEANPVTLPHFAGDGINGALQSVLIEFTQIGLWVWNSASWHETGPYLTALMIWGFGYALILVALFELVLAKMMLAVLFATAPLFIGFTVFSPTQGFFDRWLGACVGFSLLMIFISSLLALALSMAQWAIANTYANQATGCHLVSFVPIMVVGFIGVGLILKAAQLAQGIGGTVTTSSGSALLAGTVGGAVGSVFTTLKMPLAALTANKWRGLYQPSTTDTTLLNSLRHDLIKTETSYDPHSNDSTRP